MMNTDWKVVAIRGRCRDVIGDNEYISKQEDKGRVEGLRCPVRKVRQNERVR